MSEIFSGMNSANPMEICDALGWSNNLRQEDLVGAIMTLCRTVTAQSNRIDSLCVEVLKLRGVNFCPLMPGIVFAGLEQLSLGSPALD